MIFLSILDNNNISMTNIIQKDKQKDVHLHIDKAYEIIEKGMPSDYAVKVKSLIGNSSIPESTIRNIKNRTSQWPTKRLNILNALVVVAKEFQKEVDALEDLVKN